MKKITFLIFCNIMLIKPLYANESLNSEISHVTGGLLLAGGITMAVDHYYPEHRDKRGMIGFKISSTAAIAEQLIEYAVHGNGKGQLLDATAHILGSAIGARITDKYILMPVVKNSSGDRQYIGVSFQYAF